MRATTDTVGSIAHTNTWDVQSRDRMRVPPVGRAQELNLLAHCHLTQELADVGVEKGPLHIGLHGWVPEGSRGMAATIVCRLRDAVSIKAPLPRRHPSGVACEMMSSGARSVNTYTRGRDFLDLLPSRASHWTTPTPTSRSIRCAGHTCSCWYRRFQTYKKAQYAVRRASGARRLLRALEYLATIKASQLVR
jgi:hypothetical protein